MSDEKYADKINKLLTKAESTTPEEAELLYEKAQELMTRYGIEEAMLRQAKQGVVEDPTEIVLEYRGGTRKALYRLGHALAKYNGCRAFFVDRRPAFGGRYTAVTVIGFPKDLERVEMLDTSIRLQCAVALKKFAKEHIDPSWHRGVKRDEKREFVLGFVDGISTKLAAAEKKATAAAEEASGEEASGEPGVALALRSRKDRVDDWTDKQYPGLRPIRSRMRRGSVSSKVVGERAGKRADVGGTKLGGRKELTA